MLLEYILVEHGNEMTEHDRIGDLHHGGFEVNGEQHTLCLGIVDLLLNEFAQSLGAHEGAVKNFASLQSQLLLQNRDLAGLVDKLDFDIAGLFHGDRLFTVIKITGIHMGNMGLGIRSSRRPFCADVFLHTPLPRGLSVCRSCLHAEPG